MASLQESKRRINSVTVTKKITRAMQLVATAKLKRAKKNLIGIQEYYTSVYETFQDLLSNINNLPNLFNTKSKKDSTLYLVITSDLGLCGGYNANVFKILKNSFKENDKVIMIGTKGVSHWRAIGKKAYEEYPGLGDEPNYDYASKISATTLSLFESGEINKVEIIFTRFVNSITFTPLKLQLLPVDQMQAHNFDSVVKQKKVKAVTAFEPSPEVVIANSLPLFITAVIFGALVESKVSEMSSRRTAMENATDNAEELIKSLNLEYNRARQSAITQEISEIVAGAEAL